MLVDLLKTGGRALVSSRITPRSGLSRRRYYLVDPLFARLFWPRVEQRAAAQRLPVIFFTRYTGINELPGAAADDRSPSKIYFPIPSTHFVGRSFCNSRCLSRIDLLDERPLSGRQIALSLKRVHVKRRLHSQTN